MNACSYSMRTWLLRFSRFGSAIACSVAPARSSSQLLPQDMFMSRPVSEDMECALGFCVPAGASINVW